MAFREIPVVLKIRTKTCMDCYKEHKKIVTAQSSATLDFNDHDNLFDLLENSFKEKIDDLYETTSKLKASYPNDGNIAKTNEEIGKLATTAKRVVLRDLPEIKKIFIAAQEISQQSA